MSLPFLSQDQLDAFILVLLRVSAIVALIPVLSERSVPVKVKASICLIVSLLVFPLVHAQIPPLQNLHVIELAFLMIGETLIGITIGFLARLIFAAIQLAGNIIGFQMGFAIVNVIDPGSSQQVSIIAEFKYLLAMLLFLAVNAHHLFFQAITYSYTVIQPLSFHLSGELMQFVFDVSKEMFVIALKIAAPITAVMLFTNVGLGIVARTVPQMNIFIVGFPLQISMGLIFLGISAPLFVRLTQQIFVGLQGTIFAVLRLM